MSNKKKARNYLFDEIDSDLPWLEIGKKVFDKEISILCDPKCVYISKPTKQDRKPGINEVWCTYKNREAVVSGSSPCPHNGPYTKERL